MKSNAKQDTPLPNELEARHVAAILVCSVLATQTPLDVCISRSPEYRALKPENRAFALRLMQQYFRNLGQVEVTIKHFMLRPLSLAMHYVEVQMGLAMVQIAHMDIPPYAAVHSAVELVKRDFEAHAALVNAVLNSWLKQGEPKLYGEGMDNIPLWLRNRWQASYGDVVVQGIARALAATPPLDFSTKHAAAREALLAVLAEKEAYACVDSVRVAYPPMVSEIAGYNTGDWWIQDVAATLPVMLLGDVTGKRVWDMCAAPGGKAMQLAARGAQVVATESSKKRILTMQENLARTGFTQVQCIVQDALKYVPDAPFDGILLDAPCSATGTLRRNPDMLWNRTPANIGEQLHKQYLLLKHAADVLPVGRVLVYAVCSLELEEGDGQIARLLKDEKNIIVDIHSFDMPHAELLAGDYGMRCLPHMMQGQGGMDGFFMTRLRKL